MSLSPADFLAAERLFAASYPSEVDFFAALHEATRRLIHTDAYYLCRVQRSPDWLHFVYNCEGDRYDKPGPWPFGNGPTSRVARDGKPVVIGRPEDREAYELHRFADATTISGSAIHWPLWIESEPPALPDGVLSVQAYVSEAYDTEALAAVEWLALRTAEALRRESAAERTRRAVAAAELIASRNQAIDDVRRFVDLLDDLVLLREEPRRLLAEARRQQVELTAWAPNVPVARDETSDALAELSEREIEVLVHVSQGLSNEETAEVLMCSKHTVKRHLDNVYRQTPLRNRSEVANAAGTIRGLYMARKGDGKSASSGNGA